jgi:hypothetical protein
MRKLKKPSSNFRNDVQRCDCRGISADQPIATTPR